MRAWSRVCESVLGYVYDRKGSDVCRYGNYKLKITLPNIHCITAFFKFVYTHFLFVCVRFVAIFDVVFFM